MSCRWFGSQDHYYRRFFASFTLFTLAFLLPFIITSCRNNPASSGVPPLVVITSPVEGAHLTGPVKVVTATTDNVGISEVDFYVDSTLVGKATASPFNYLWNVGFWADGKSHSLYARAININGLAGTSQVVTVTISDSAIAFPEIIGPEDNQHFDTNAVSLQWHQIPSAKQYDVQVATTSDYSSPVTSTTTADTAYSLSNLTYSDYYWRVRAVGPNGNLSAWSSGGSFNTFLNPPSGIAPVGGQYSGQPETTFQWTLVPKAVQYEIQVSSDSLFGGSLFSTTTSNTSTAASGLPDSLWLYWRVRSIAPGGIDCPWSSAFLFSRFISFMKVYTGQSISAAIQTSDSGYVIAGGESATRLNKFGAVVWQKSFADTIRSVQQASDGGFILVGESSSQSAWAAKTDGSGAVQWSKTYGTNSSFASVGVMTDGNFICGGVNGSAWAVKLSGSGDTLWTEHPGADQIDNVEATNDGGALLSGSINGGSPSAISPAWVMKINSSGVSQWTYTENACPPPTESYALCASQFPDGSSICLFHHPCNVFWDVTKLNADGSSQWSTNIAGYTLTSPTLPNGSNATWIQALPDGDCVSCGNGGGSIVFQEFDGSGTLMTQKLINAPFPGDVIVACFDGGFLIAGGSGVVKTDPNGDFIN